METELLKKLVSIPSHFGEEDEISNFIGSLLEEYGLPVEYQEVEGFGSNIISKIKGKRITVVLNGHMDTVGLGSGWRRNPWGELDGDRFYGLGSADMKGGLAALIVAFIEASNLPRRKRPTVVFTAVVDEEGYSRGTWKLIEEGKLKDANLVLVAEPTNESLMLGARGRYVIKLKVRGKKAHAARPHDGINAIEELSRLLAIIPRIKTRKHSKLGSGSYCTLYVHGEADGLSVPEEAEAIVDRHVVIGEDWERVVRELKNAAERVKMRGDLEISRLPRPTPEMLPYIVRENNRFVSLLSRVYSLLWGRTPEITYGKSVGDFNYFGTYLGVPTIVFGPVGGNWHSADEWVSISSVKRVKETYLEFLRVLGSGKRLAELVEMKDYAPS